MRLIPIAVSGLVLAAASAAPLSAAGPARDDKAEIATIMKVFERAVNENNFDLVKPYFDPSFKGKSIAGTDMVGLDQVKAFMTRARALMGRGSKYRLKLKPDAVDVSGDTGKTFGTTEEEIVLADGKKLDYKSNWSVDLVRRDGRWMAKSSDTQLDFKDQMTIAAHVVASRIIDGGLQFRGLRLGRPDWDKDGGAHKP